MTRYEYLKSIPKADYMKLKSCGVLKSCTDFYIEIYDEFAMQVNSGIQIMQAYTNVSEIMCTSEESVRKIVYNLTKDIVVE